MLAAGQKRGADEGDGGMMMMQEMPMTAEQQQQQQQMAMMMQQQQQQEGSNGHPGIKRRMVSLAPFVACVGTRSRLLIFTPALLDRRTRCRKLNQVQCLEWTRQWILQPPFTRLVRLHSWPSSYRGRITEERHPDMLILQCLDPSAHEQLQQQQQMQANFFAEQQRPKHP